MVSLDKSELIDFNVDGTKFCVLTNDSFIYIFNLKAEFLIGFVLKYGHDICGLSFTNLFIFLLTQSVLNIV